MAVQDLCGTDTGTDHVFIPRTASRFIRDLLFTVSLWWTGECMTCKAMPCWHQDSYKYSTVQVTCPGTRYDGKGRAR